MQVMQQAGVEVDRVIDEEDGDLGAGQRGRSGGCCAGVGARGRAQGLAWVWNGRRLTATTPNIISSDIILCTIISCSKNQREDGRQSECVVQEVGSAAHLAAIALGEVHRPCLKPIDQDHEQNHEEGDLPDLGFQDAIRK